MTRSTAVGMIDIMTEDLKLSGSITHIKIMTMRSESDIFPMMVSKDDAPRLNGEILNVSLSPDADFAMTSSNVDDMVILWDMKKRKDLDYRKITKPKGVVFINDSREKYCLLIHEFGISLYNLKNGNLKDELDLFAFGTSETPDSHVFMLS